MNKNDELICVPTFGLKQYCAHARLRCRDGIESWVHRKIYVFSLHTTVEVSWYTTSSRCLTFIPRVVKALYMCGIIKMNSLIVMIKYSFSK